MTDARDTGPTCEEPYVPDEIDEWEWFVDYLREPGRLSAAVVPGQREGEALLARLREELGEESFLVAEDDVLPVATGYLAAEAGSQGKILVLALDGRRKFPDAREQRRFWYALNFQREALASGNNRTLLLLDEGGDQHLIFCADDLLEWVMTFRFPDGVWDVTC